MDARLDATQQLASISALEAATDALMIALGRRPEPDLEAAVAALKAREAALRFLLAVDAGRRPPEIAARLRRVLEKDRLTADQMREQMDALRGRIEETKQLMRNFRDRGQIAHAAPVAAPIAAGHR
jgi:hypothetical protein